MHDRANGGAANDVTVGGARAGRDADDRGTGDANAFGPDDVAIRDDDDHDDHDRPGPAVWHDASGHPVWHDACGQAGDTGAISASAHGRTSRGACADTGDGAHRQRRDRHGEARRYARDQRLS